MSLVVKVICKWRINKGLSLNHPNLLRHVYFRCFSVASPLFYARETKAVIAAFKDPKSPVTFLFQHYTLQTDPTLLFLDGLNGKCSFHLSFMLFYACLKKICSRHRDQNAALLDYKIYQSLTPTCRKLNS